MLKLDYRPQVRRCNLLQSFLTYACLPVTLLMVRSSYSIYTMLTSQDKVYLILSLVLQAIKVQSYVIPVVTVSGRRFVPLHLALPLFVPQTGCNCFNGMLLTSVQDVLQPHAKMDDTGTKRHDHLQSPLGVYSPLALFATTVVTILILIPS